MVDWIIKPRKTGKTTQLINWWLEDPENRVIIEPDYSMVTNVITMIKAKMFESTTIIPTWMYNFVVSGVETLLKRNILSFHEVDNNLRGRRNIEIGVDNLDHMLFSIFSGHEVKFVTATGGTNE